MSSQGTSSSPADVSQGSTKGKRPSKPKTAPANADGSAASTRAPKAHFSYEDSRRLICARTLLDYHYDQRINSAQTKQQFVTEKYNDGFDMPSSLMVGAESDIRFEALPPNERKSDAQLQRKFEVMSASMRAINIASQEQSILNQITLKTHAAGEKRDQDALKTEVYEEIEDLKKLRVDDFM